MKSLDSHATMESRATRHSAVSAFTETVEFLERNLALMLMRYCCSMIGCYFFLDMIGSQKRISTYNFHIIITDRLLAAGNHIESCENELQVSNYFPFESYTLLMVKMTRKQFYFICEKSEQRMG